MARPRSEDKRRAILDAATRVIVAEGLSAPTATIAREAGVANGSLFTYFETKTELLNQLYLDLKGGMAAAALDGLPEGAELHAQMLRVWSNWMNWATEFPEKRRALAQLSISEEITETSREAGHKIMAGFGGLLGRCRALGAMRDIPMAFVVAIMNSLADATMEYMVQDPEQAELHSRVGFEALWRVLA